MCESLAVRGCQNGSVEFQGGNERPLYLRPTNIALVFAGGALGTLARELLMLAVPSTGRLPLSILIANLSGALLLGLLLEMLGRPGERGSLHQRVRAFLGTGVLGGFTTYSALAGATAVMLNDGLPLLALGYALGSVALGVLAAWLGVALGRIGSGAGKKAVA